MAWRIGIDEAGYGPNLGPLVMTAVACQVPDEFLLSDLWDILSRAVCRTRRKKKVADCRVMVNDSKLVYSGANGLAELERSVLALLGASSPTGWGKISQLIEHLCPGARKRFSAKSGSAMRRRCRLPPRWNRSQRAGIFCRKCRPSRILSGAQCDRWLSARADSTTWSSGPIARGRCWRRDWSNCCAGISLRKRAKRCTWPSTSTGAETFTSTWSAAPATAR